MKTQGLAIAGLMLLSSVVMSSRVARAEGVQWLTDAPTALQQSRSTGRPVLMRFSAEWCGPCRKMERTTFAEPATADAIHRSFVPLVIDADKNEALAQQLNIRGLPTLLVVTPDMNILAQIKGFQTSERLMPQLYEALNQHQRSGGVPAQPVARHRSAPMSNEPNPFMTGEQQPATQIRGSTGGAVVARRDSNQRPRTQPAASFEGYCLTSVVEQRKLIKGTPEFESSYRGQTLYFQDDDQRDQFFETPEKYWPALDGRCPMTLLDSGESAPGKLRYAAVFRGQIWLMSDREKMNRFIESPADAASQVLELRKTAGTPGQSF